MRCGRTLSPTIPWSCAPPPWMDVCPLVRVAAGGGPRVLADCRFPDWLRWRRRRGPGSHGARQRACDTSSAAADSAPDQARLALLSLPFGEASAACLRSRLPARSSRPGRPQVSAAPSASPGRRRPRSSRGASPPPARARCSVAPTEGGTAGASDGSGLDASGSGRRLEGLSHVDEQVVDVLDADGQSNQSVREPGGATDLRRDGRVGHGGRHLDQ